MAKQKKSPEVRFDGFTEDWKEKDLENEVVFFTGLTYSPNDIVSKSGTLVIRSSNIKNGQLVNADNVYVDSSVVNSENVKAGDIAVVVRNGSRSLIGKHAQIHTDLENTVIGAFMTGIRSEKNCDFIYALLDTKHFKKEIEKNLGATINQITTGAFRKMQFHFPDKDEQKRIGVLFRKINESISFHKAKYDKLQKLKKAMLIKMFPQNGAAVPEIRIKGFEGTWKTSSLETEIEFFSGLTYSPSDVNKDGGVLVLRSSNVKNDEIIDADNVYVNTQVINCSYVETGDIIVVVRNGSRSLIGKHARVKEEMKNTVIGAFMTGIRSERSSFINALLSTRKFKKQIDENLGATINQITTGVFKNMEFDFPKVEEQNLIGKYFDKIDTVISIHKRELKKLENIKKAFLNKLFVQEAEIPPARI